MNGEKIMVKVKVPFLILYGKKYKEGDVVIVSEGVARINKLFGFVDVVGVVEREKEEKPKSTAEKPKKKRTTRKKKGMPKKAEVQEVKYETK